MGQALVARMISPILLAMTLLPRASDAGPKDDLPRRIETAQDDAGIARSLAVTISTAKSEFSQLEPVIIEVEAKNVDPDQSVLTFPSGYSQYRYTRVKIYGGGDELIPETRHHQIAKNEVYGGSGDSGGVNLLPAKVSRSRLVANLVGDMTDPDEYTIVVELDFSYHASGTRHWATARSNAVKVKVVEGVAAPGP